MVVSYESETCSLVVAGRRVIMLVLMAGIKERLVV